MNIFAEWWAKFVAHKTRQNEQAAQDVQKRISPVENAPSDPRADRRD